MARIVKCPKCGTQVDAANMPPASTVPCANCGTLMRIPTGSSAQHPAATPPQAPEQKKATKVRQRGGGSRGGRVARKKSNSGLVIGLSLGGLALVIVVAVVAANSGGSGQATPNNSSSASAPNPAPPPQQQPAAPAPAPANPDTNPPPKPKPMATRNPETANWPKLMRMLRPGGGFDAMDRPEGQAFKIVKSMGKGAYPHLVKYLGDEDITLARAAVAVLNELTGRNSKLPNEITRPQIKSDWEKWLEDNK